MVLLLQGISLWQRPDRQFSTIQYKYQIRRNESLLEQAESHILNRVVYNNFFTDSFKHFEGSFELGF